MEPNERLLTPAEMQRALYDHAFKLQTEERLMMLEDRFEALCWAQDAKTLKWLVNLLRECRNTQPTEVTVDLQLPVRVWHELQGEERTDGLENTYNLLWHLQGPGRCGDREAPVPGGDRLLHRTLSL